MEKKPESTNGRHPLEEAMQMLIQTQASFLQRMADSDRRHAEAERRQAEFERRCEERFTRIERDLASVVRLLTEQAAVLERLPDAIRDRIGFKSPKK